MHTSDFYIKDTNAFLFPIYFNCNHKSILYLVANKADKESDAEVKYEEGVSFAKQNKFDYFCETSAKNKQRDKGPIFQNRKAIIHQV